MRGSILVFLFFTVACVPGAQRDVKFQQYYAEGEVLYQQHCANCHQADGSGLGRLYPPLAKSDFINKDPQAVLCLIKYGIEGEMVVNGVTYNKPMPGIPSLTELEIAEIVTYINNSWGNAHPMVTVNDATTILNTCSTSN